MVIDRWMDDDGDYNKGIVSIVKARTRTRKMEDGGWKEKMWNI